MSRPKFYGVITTGIYCRFGCASRTPRPENVVYLFSRAEAEDAGLRPCKRCRPDQLVAPHQAFREFVVTQLLALTKQEPGITIANAAGKLSISPRQLERIVAIQTGLSPRVFIRKQETTHNSVISDNASERITT